MNQTRKPFVLSQDTLITCPQCSRRFAVTEGFAKQAFEQMHESSAAAIAVWREEERVAAVHSAQTLAAQREVAHAQALEEARADTARAATQRIETLQEELAIQAARLAAIDQREFQLATRERLMESRVAEAAAKRAAELVAGERQDFDKRRSQELQRNSLKEAELQKTIADMRAQLVEAQRKADQGSQQLQGEVLELAIEEGLRRAFPLDTIEEIKKGQRGGDVLQHVVTRAGEVAGSILWETKRAKDWSSQWTPRLKENMRACGAAVGILVTMPGALPRDWPDGAYFSMYEDVWVTQASTAASIAQALRSGLIDLHRQRAISRGKGEKMEALYDYLTSPQFAQKLRAVFDTFKKMREELEAEKNMTMQRWARREKQLQGGINELLGIGGEIQGLAQGEFPMLEMELPRDGMDS